jgi:hypothetical protein
MFKQKYLLPNKYFNKLSTEKFTTDVTLMLNKLESSYWDGNVPMPLVINEAMKY